MNGNWQWSKHRLGTIVLKIANILADAKRTRSYFLGSTYIGIIMQCKTNDDNRSPKFKILALLLRGSIICLKKVLLV